MPKPTLLTRPEQNKVSIMRQSDVDEAVETIHYIMAIGFEHKCKNQWCSLIVSYLEAKTEIPQVAVLCCFS